MATKNCCFKGRGEIAVVDYSKALLKTAGLISMGNSNECAVNLTETKEAVKDFTSPGGGTDCSSREIDEVEVTLNILCAKAENVALGLYGVGTTDNVDTAAVVGELHVAWLGAIVPLSGIPDPDVAIVVKNVAGDTTYVAGTDYEITPSGSIRTLVGTTIAVPTVTAGVGQPNIAVTFTRRVQSLIQLVTRKSNPVLFHFDGFNIMAGNQATHFDLYRVEFGPARNFQLISGNAASLQLTGTATRDPSKSVGTLNAPLSQYGTLRI